MSTKTTQSEKQKVPKLRFAGFDDGWEEKKLGDLCDVKGGKRIPLGYSLQSENNSFPYITVSDMNDGSVSLEKIKYVPEVIVKQIKNYTISCNDIFVSVAGTLGLVGIIPKELEYANLTENADKLTNIKCDKNFLLHFLNGDSLKKLIESTKTSNAQPKLAIYALKTLKLNIPNAKEQQKIAGFLGGVDEWIDGLKKEKENFELYKKAMMQKLFGQEIRFKDDKGNEFPKWEEKKLGEVGETYNGLRGKVGDDFGEGDSFITYKQIFDDSEINIGKFALVTVNSQEKQNKAQFGDILFTTSSETPHEVGFSSVLLDKSVSPYLNSFSFGIRPNSLKELDPYFAKLFFRSPLFRKDVVKLAQGSTRYNISKIGFMKIRITLPFFPEQQKIADFLTSVDKVIESKQQQISQAEQWKNGLMQGLFV